MVYRALLVAVVLAAGTAARSEADIVVTDNGIAVKESSVATPSRGMTMSEVVSKFGEPVAKVPAVGQPPISRWEYSGFVVYFEREHVLHTVVADSPGAPAAPAAPPSTAAAPANAATASN